MLHLLPEIPAPFSFLKKKEEYIYIYVILRSWFFQLHFFPPAYGVNGEKIENPW